MDITPYTEPKIAPRAVFDTLPERSSRPRFMVPTATGDWSVVTWGAFARQIRECALFLGTGGVLEPGERGCVFAANRVEWVSAALAIQATGGVMVPVYASSTAEQAAYVIAHSDARVVFVDSPALLGRLFEAWESLEGVRRVVLLDDALDPWAVLARLRSKAIPLPTVADVERRVIHWSRALAAGRAVELESHGLFERRMGAVDVDQPGLMLYTSGTSGNPKGVPLTHRNVASNGLDWLHCNGPLIDESAVDLLWLPMSHIFGFGEACLGNTLGFTSYLVEPVSALAKLPEVQPSVFMSVPSVWEKIAMAAMAETSPERRRARLAEVTGGRLRFCLSGGAGLKQEIKEFLHEHGLLIIEGYGLTEASPTLTLNRPDAFRFDTVGRPLPSVELRLAEDGEILAKGPNVFAGYHKDPVATAETFTADGWLKTGDIGRFTEDGFLQIIDRKKDILVTAGGKNVAPQNIELRFADHALIAHVVVYGDGRKYLTAGVWVNQEIARAQMADEAIGPDEADAWLRGRVQACVDAVNAGLASYETIKKFQIISDPLTVEGGLLTPTLKVKRKQVYARYGASLEGLYA